MAGAHIVIVAGEASGDMHGANLIRAMRKRDPELNVSGMGGSELVAAGMEKLFDASRLAVVGLSEVLFHIRDIRKAQKILDRELRDKRPDLLILIDYPDFNLMLAKKAQKYGVPIFYYISPQVWAWRSGRVNKIARLVDRMAVILPFEQEFYRQRGYHVDFVGHPLMDVVRATMTREQFLAKIGVKPENPVIGILPGSRQKEVSALLPVFLEVAQRIRDEMHSATFLIPQASTITTRDLDRYGLRDNALDIRVISGDRYNLMTSCDAVMAASGTVTLELAILNVPMVVAYKVSPLTYFLGRPLVSVQYASLVNLVAGREVVPEFLQDEATAENIYYRINSLLKDKKSRGNMLKELQMVRKAMGGGGASARAAGLALNLIKTGQEDKE